MFGEPDQQRVAPRVEQSIADLGWDRRKLLLTGLMCGGVEPVQGAQCLVGPGLLGMGFAGSDEFAGQVRVIPTSG